MPPPPPMQLPSTRMGGRSLLDMRPQTQTFRQLQTHINLPIPVVDRLFSLQSLTRRRPAPLHWCTPLTLAVPLTPAFPAMGGQTAPQSPSMLSARSILRDGRMVAFRPRREPFSP